MVYWSLDDLLLINSLQWSVIDLMFCVQLIGFTFWMETFTNNNIPPLPCSYIVYKEPGNWGPLTILIKPQRTDMRFANLLMVVIILNDTGETGVREYEMVVKWRHNWVTIAYSHATFVSIAVDLSDAIKLTSHGEPVYSYTTFCAPAGQYRIILQSSNEEPIHVELVHKYEHMHQIWTHSSQLLPVRIRCRRRKQNKQMLIKWDKWWGGDCCTLIADVLLIHWFSSLQQCRWQCNAVLYCDKQPTRL